MFGASFGLNTLAWHNNIRLRSSILLVLDPNVMLNRGSWGPLYFAARGEILRFATDKLLRKHLPKMFSLIKNES